jgi:hypothetical protein
LLCYQSTRATVSNILRILENTADQLLLVEAVALIVQIHLQQNRTDLAVKEVQAARRWAQDSLLVNIAESWVGLRVVWLPMDILPIQY